VAGVAYAAASSISTDLPALAIGGAAALAAMAVLVYRLRSTLAGLRAA